MVKGIMERTLPSRPIARTLASLAVVLLTLSAGAVAADTQIVAGKRVGAVSLGMTVAQVETQVGKAQTGRAPSSEHTLAIFPLPGKGELHVEFSGGKAIRIGTNAREYATSDGIALGASQGVVRAKHPHVTETEYDVRRRGGMTAQCYDDVANGIGFEFDRSAAKADFALVAIYVHAAGKPAPCGREDDPRATKKLGASK